MQFYTKPKSYNEEIFQYIDAFLGDTGLTLDVAVKNYLKCKHSAH